ncbi:MAG: hypothetical protein M0R48_08125 [Candidatus Omnitrophica bacterium]|jgi:ribosomal protein L37AE/L43A|nr:hypothetical protein [Candidatus Omnitrophota bacterium]
MKIELSVFLAIISSVLIVGVMVIELIEERKKTMARKDTHLRKEKCEVCTSLYFISSALKYWRCPYCNSLNK